MYQQLGNCNGKRGDRGGGRGVNGTDKGKDILRNVHFQHTCGLCKHVLCLVRLPIVGKGILY